MSKALFRNQLSTEVVLLLKCITLVLEGPSFHPQEEISYEMLLKCVNTWNQFWIIIIVNTVCVFFGLGMLVQVWGCCRPNLHAAGGSATPTSPSPVQVIHVISICVQILLAVCSLHSSLLETCVSVRNCLLITVYHCFQRPLCTCVFLPLCGVTADNCSTKHCVLHRQLEFVNPTKKCGRSWL